MTTTQRSREEPSAANDTTESARACVEVMILWGATALHVAHLDPPRSFCVGEASGDEEGERKESAIDCFVPAEVLGVKRAPLVVVEKNGAVSVAVLPGATGSIEIEGEAAIAIEDAAHGAGSRACAEVPGARLVTLPRGAKARIELGGVVFKVGVTTAGRAVAGHFYIGKRGLPFALGSAIVHAGVLGALAFYHPASNPDDSGEPTADQVFAMQQYLLSAEEKELEEQETEEVAEATADGKLGMPGARAKGEEGSTGSASFGAGRNRYGVQGPSDPQRAPVTREQAARDAAEFGMIGLLNAGAGGDPNAPTATWGRDSGAGGPAGGNEWGSAIGDAFGAGGLGLSGIGAGGGGRGASAQTSRAPQAAQAAQVAQAPAPATEAPAEARIDPNGRFATTYRPGGGHLSAFESAVARGIVPAGEREIVSDIGARYTPSLDVEAGRALAIRPDLERRELPPSGGAFHLRLALQGAKEAGARPHLSVHLVLDVSGSMAGEPIARAREAAEALVDRLAPTDDFSLVTFSSEAKVWVPDGLVGPRREAIKEVIRGLREQGGTNIAEGLSLAYVQASQASIPEDAVRVVLLLSDGRATAGDTNSERISRLSLDAFQRGIQTSAFGLGSDYDGALMSSIASDGAGGYYYLRDGEQIAPALSTELDKRLDPVATAVEVRVRLKREVDLLRVYGSRRLSEAESARVRAVEVAADRQAEARDHIKADRQSDSEGGMRFFIPAFARGDSHALLLKLAVPAGVGTRGVASVEIKYKDRLSKKNVVEEIPVSVTFAGSDAASASTMDASVARTVQGFAAGEALTEASQRIARGNREGAIALLAEREEILTQAASTLSEPLFLRDASRLARLRAHAGSSGGVGDPLVLAMLLETAGRSHLH
jgi:Mg-chelatase subunit ChlD